MRRVLVLVFCCVSVVLMAGPLSRIMRHLEKGNLDKVEKIIKKELEDEPVNPGIKYFYSILFLEPAYPRYSIDSAYVYIKEAISDLDTASPDLLMDMKDEGLSIEDLDKQLESVAQLHFYRAEKEMTISRWNDFIRQFPDSKLLTEATTTRDSLVFDTVQQDVSIDKLNSFLDQYPESHLREKAKNQLDSLKILAFREKQTVSDLERFVSQNPDSEFLEDALEELLELKTLAGRAVDFMSFISSMPKTSVTDWAIHVLYHLDKEADFRDFKHYVDYHSQSDSLLTVRKWEDELLLPHYENTYQFIAKTGTKFYTVLNEVNPKILCEGLSSDVMGGTTLRNKHLILSKLGQSIAEGRIVKMLTHGFMLVQRDQNKAIIHKTGKTITNQVQDADVLSPFVSIKKNNKWGLFSYLGAQLAPYRYDSIFTEGNFWIFQRDERFAVTTQQKLIDAFPEGLYLEFKFEEFELVNDDQMIGFRGRRECLLNSTGRFEVPWGEHHIYPDDERGYIRSRKGYAFYQSQPLTFMEYIAVNENFTVRKEGENQWMLIANNHDWVLPLADSVKLINDFAAMVLASQPFMIFANQNQRPLKSGSVPVQLSPELPYIQIKEQRKITLLDGKGDEVFSGFYEQVQALNDTLFNVSQRGQHGLITTSGETVLPAKYDFLSLENGMIQTLQRSKIGALDLTNMKLFSAEYDTKITRFGTLYKARKNGRYGLINAEEEVVLPFRYDDVLPWTEEQVWAQQGDQYVLLTLENAEERRRVGSLKPMSQEPQLVYKYYGARGFGLMGNKTGHMLAANFTDIRWLNDPKYGILVAEQSLPESGFLIISYFGMKGEKLASFAYQEGTIEKILCDE